jgi:hypothetical protein
MADSLNLTHSYKLRTVEHTVQAAVTFHGIVVSGSLDPVLLERKYEDLITSSPILGGVLVKGVSNF